MGIIGIKITLVTVLITRLGNEAALITYAAARTIIPIILIPSFGLMAATEPMLGFNVTKIIDITSKQNSKQRVHYSILVKNTIELEQLKVSVWRNQVKGLFFNTVSNNKGFVF